MWQLFVFLFGFVFCSDNISNVETLAGEDVNLQCPGTITTDGIQTITWKPSNGDILFHCDRFSTPCETNTTTHTLGRNHTFISTVTIQNVSLVHEDEYSFKMISETYRKTCTINLTVTVPPKGLILFEKDYGNIIQVQGSLTVAEGENQTLLCKTNASVKPSVDLEWEIPNGLNAYVHSQKYANDEHDTRLFVPSRTIHFTPTYADDDDIVLVCKVASKSSFGHIQTSVLIKNKGELTTSSTTLGTGSTKSHTMTGSSGTCCTTFDPSNPGPKLWYKQVYVVIPGCSGVVMLLVVLAFVGGFIRSKKRDGRRPVPAESTEVRLPQARRALPPTPSDQSSLPANHLPNQPPLTSRLFRPVPSNPPDMPMRPLVPVSEDAIRSPAERTGSRMPGETFMTTDGSSPVTQFQKELDTELEYDFLNISHHGAPGAIPHVYRETTNGLAEYALVSRQNVDTKIDHRQLHRSKQMDDDSDYDLLNTWNHAEHGTVPHVYKGTTSGLAEYAVVSKPDDKKKRQSLGPLTKVMKAPINAEAEYAVVDKSKKRAKESKPSHL